MTKVCTRCHRRKPLDGYYKDARSSDGRQSDCKSCHLAGIKPSPAKRAAAKRYQRSHMAAIVDQNRRRRAERRAEGTLPSSAASVRRWQLAHWADHMLQRRMANRLHRNKALRERVMERDGRRCTLCGSDQQLCFSRVVPVLKGGTNDEANLRIRCRPCRAMHARAAPSTAG